MKEIRCGYCNNVIKHHNHMSYKEIWYCNLNCLNAADVIQTAQPKKVTRVKLGLSYEQQSPGLFLYNPDTGKILTSDVYGTNCNDVLLDRISEAFNNIIIEIPEDN